MSKLTYSFYFAQFLATIATAGMTFSALFIASFVSSITKKFGKKEAGSFALIGAGFIYVLAFVLSIQNPLVFAILLIVAGIVMGYYTISMHAYVTDVIDDFYFKRGTSKVAQAIAGFLAGALLTQIGHVSGAEQQTDEVANSISLQKSIETFQLK
ncbi:hypothetical protein FPV25_00825 [Carnobacterium sp. PL17GRE32]|uniref:MFS transporter n=1 Tax=Carnobacterium sp. PL17GRE32 TaxID=2592355 RepID=UPI0011EFED64|nr:MFS transporter [Carnobacterium sp. PL17GRE32]KAF3306811.1 hypothetical protein FPV25_00825 [Carnobacterium sp. PL17GRE32]